MANNAVIAIAIAVSASLQKQAGSPAFTQRFQNTSIGTHIHHLHTVCVCVSDCSLGQDRWDWWQCRLLHPEGPEGRTKQGTGVSPLPGRRVLQLVAAGAFPPPSLSLLQHPAARQREGVRRSKGRRMSGTMTRRIIGFYEE